MKILVLYEELAWYFVNCINVLSENYRCEILVFCKKTNANAPFEFKEIHPNINIKNREEYNSVQFTETSTNFAPDLVFIGGWSHKPYLSLLKKLKTQNTIIGFDNQWSGSLKQILGAFYFKLFIKPFIKFAFVPGPRQVEFAKKIGFKNKNIITNAYSCDFNLFNKYYRKHKENKHKQFPKRFLFTGRYENEKNIQLLWESFIELQNEEKNEWELWCLGKGSIKPIQHEKIKHVGFIQPNELNDIIKNTGVFVLPSLFEPWGVVVHEYAAAGYPLLCSKKVGSTDIFLKENENGFLLKSGEKKELKALLKKYMCMSDEKLILMSEKSVAMAAQITPETWANQLMRINKV